MLKLLEQKGGEGKKKKKKGMGDYLTWVEALASAWVFMVLIGLVCCCLSSKPRPQGDTSGCTCDGGYEGV